MNPTVSIIVPVYNAEKVIRRCVDSILEQEYTDFELILVNDGSKDASGEICNEYAAEDPRVQVIHKENSGVSDTRNTALAHARGTYLQFLDSDDWITPDATRLLVEAAKEHDCDMVIADFYRVVGERVSHKGSIEESGLMTREVFVDCMMENPADFYYGVIWNKLYRREIVENHKLRMNPDISWCEDFMFNLEYIRHCSTIYALQVPIYYYVKTKGSLVSQSLGITKTIKMKLMVFEYYNDFYKQVLTEEEYEKKRLQVYRFLIDAASDGAVPPSIMPGSKKLGEERNRVSQAIVDGDGVLADVYRERKLLDYYLEPVAMKHELTVDDLRVLLGLTVAQQSENRRELADFVGISPSSLAIILKKLYQKEIARVEKRRNQSELKITYLEHAEAILAEIADAVCKFEQVKVAGFTEEEIEQYRMLTEKVKVNIQKIL